MENFVQAWIANDDNEIEGEWEDWYTDQVENTQENIIEKQENRFAMILD